VRFDHLPKRLVAGMKRWPLERSAVLDVGSSYGMCLMHFGTGSVGIDNHDESVAFTRALGRETILADVEDTKALAQVLDGAFDYLWVSDVLEHVEAPRLVLRRLAPKLKPGGSLLLHASVLPRSRPARWALRRLGERPYDAEVHYHQWTIDTIRHLVARAGFRTVRIVPLLSVPAGVASRVFLEAVPDIALTEQADRAVARNRHD
jgi:SAM-dependent methyltransferase